MGRHFLTGASGSAGISIERTGTLLAHTVEIAADSATRRRGLLGRSDLPEGHAFVIAPCQGVHTFGMGFGIDVIALNREGRVVKLRQHVRPNRVVLALRAFAILETPEGLLARTGIRVGDRLILIR